MKQTITLIFIMIAKLAICQSFEGTLIYTTDVELSPKLEKMGMTKQSLIDKMNADGSYTDTLYVSYKLGDYYHKSSNGIKSWLIYKSETNKIYSIQDGIKNEICSVIDASIDTEFAYFNKMPSVTKLDTSATVNNIVCDIVRVKWKTGTYDYYFNSSMLKVNPELYSKHIYDGWYDFLKISNSLPIKIVKKGNDIMTVTLTLLSSNNSKIEDEIFTLPELKYDKDLNLFKSPNKENMRIIIFNPPSK
jgi:hypothetical protein